MIHIDTEQASTPSSQDAVENASPKMDPALKAKWVSALRSGDYLQARGTLFDGKGHCCLGVLCKVVGLPIREDGGGVVGHGDEEASYSSYEPIFELVGGYVASHQCSMRNDGSRPEGLKPHSFSEIASYIEENL